MKEIHKNPLVEELLRTASIREVKEALSNLANYRVPLGIIELKRSMMRDLPAKHTDAGQGANFESILRNQELITFNGSEVVVSHPPTEMYVLPWGVNPWDLPFHVDIDLGGLHSIKGIYGYFAYKPYGLNVGFSKPHCIVKAGTGIEDLKEVASFSPTNGEDHQLQINFDTPLEVSYLRFEHGQTNWNFTNLMPKVLALIGEQIPQKEETSFIPFRTSNTFSSFFGINSLREIKDQIITDQFKVAKYHRVFASDTPMYINTNFVKGKGDKVEVDLSIPHDEYPNEKFGFSPAYGGNNFDYDAFLTKMKENGILTMPVLAKGFMYQNVPENNKVDKNWIPYDNGGNPYNPMDFKAHASFFFQYVARYGSVSVDESLLKVNEENKKKSGLNLIYAVSVWNEPDRDWSDDRSFADPKKMAAWLSAVIDGHMGQMGPGHGIRIADPNMIVALGGLIEQRTDYLINLYHEFSIIRKGAESLGYPVNPLARNSIVDVHYYPNDGGSQRAGSAGVPIETTDFLEKAQRLTTEVRKYYTEAIIALSETGYDSVNSDIKNNGAPLAPEEEVDEFGLNYESQARHLGRLVMYTLMGGYDQVYLFTLRDPIAINNIGFRGTFATTGLIEKRDNAKKLSWYLFKMLGSRLETFVYHSYKINKNTLIHEVLFIKGLVKARVLWIGKNILDKVKGYEINIDNHTEAIRVDYMFGLDQGKETRLPVIQNRVTLTITEELTLLITS